MKKMKLVKLMGSCSLALMLAVSGCSSAAAETTSETTGAETTASAATTTTETTAEATTVTTTAATEETSEETEETTATPIDCDVEPGYLIEHPMDSNGQIEDQLEYMDEFPGYENVNYDNMPADATLSNLSSIEDEDIRALAQEYRNNGYTIEDPAYDIECGFGLPCDGQYVFNNGFYAYRSSGRDLETFTACKMNEDLFNFFIVGYFYCENPEMTDDGTIIRYTDGVNYCEFNRDTGIATEYFVYDDLGGVG